MNNTENSLTFKNLLKHQDEDIPAAEAAVTRLENLIESKRNEIVQAQSAIPNIDHLGPKREDILAAIATGHATEGELEEFDKHADEEMSAYQQAQDESKQIVQDASQSIPGLERKLAEARTELANLHAKSKQFVLDYLKEEIDATSQVYVQTALILKEHYLKLVALSSVMRTNGGGSSAIKVEAPVLVIPAINHPLCKKHEMPNWPGTLFSGQIAGFGKETHEGSFAHKYSTIMRDIRDSGITLIA